jgi:glutamate 5-kinase
MPCARFKPALLKVSSVGTSSILDETTFQPRLELLSAVAETVCSLRRKGHRVVLVSSGAIGIGMKRMHLKKRPKALADKQVCLL